MFSDHFPLIVELLRLQRIFTGNKKGKVLSFPEDYYTKNLEGNKIVGR